MSDQTILAIGFASLVGLIISLNSRKWNLMSVSIIGMSASAIAFVYRFFGGV